MLTAQTAGSLLERSTLFFAATSAVTLFLASPSHFFVHGAAFVPLFIVATDKSFLLTRQHFLRRLWNVLAVLYIPVLFLDLSGSGEIVGPIARLLYFLQLAKLFDRNTMRDRLQLAGVSFFQILAAGVLTTEAVLLIGLLVFLVSGLTLLMVLALIRDGGEKSPAPPLLRMSASLSVATVAIGLVIFFLIPRLSLGYLQRMQAKDQIVSGFSDHMDLGLIGSIKKDSSVTMRIKRLDGEGPAGTPMHWRGIAYTTYDGKRWLKSTRALSLQRTGENTYTLDSSTPSGQLYAFQFVTEPMDSEAVFLFGRPRSVQGQFFWLERDENGTILSRYQRYYRMSYKVSGTLPERPREIPNGEIRERLLPYIELPPQEERLLEFASTITEGADTKYEACQQIETYLQQNYTYTLDLQRDESLSAVDDFLFNQKRGHCEYFATSMAMLCRASGIPARVVSGFLDGEFNTAGNFYVVRQQDAHAWVEAYFPGHGWIEFDPSPVDPSSLVLPQRDLAARIRDYWDSYKLMWDRYILTYNLWDQFYVIMEVSQAIGSVRAAARSYLDVAWSGDSGLLSRAARIVLVALAAAAVILVAMKRRASRNAAGTAYSRRKLARTAARAATAYEKFLQAAERRGYTKAESETALEFSARFPAEKRAACRELTSLYYEARFGEGLDRDVERELEALCKQVLDDALAPRT